MNAQWRQGERQRFEALGWPNRRREDWRYTKTRAIAALELNQAPHGSITTEQIAGIKLAEAYALVVLINGRFSAEHSQLGAGVTVHASDAGAAWAGLGTVAALEDAPLVALNGAKFLDGVRIDVPRGVHWSAPVEVLWVHTEADRPTEQHSRLLVIAGDGSAATILERHMGLGSQPYLSTAVTEVLTGRDATVRHVKVQDEGAAATHFATVVMKPGQGGKVESHVVSLGAATQRTAVHALFTEPNAECRLNGVFAAAEQQSLDHYTVIDHAVGNCTSHELYRGVVADSGIGSFIGRVLIGVGATGSATDQLAAVLLLGDNASANVKPQLEIDNDDVTASHGAAIGQLDAEALFYLRARGISEAQARGLLIEGFVKEVLSSLPVDGLAETLTDRILARAQRASP